MMNSKKKCWKWAVLPKSFLNTRNCWKFFLPLLRGDFRLTETYVHPAKDTPLNVDFTVLSGKQDEDTPEEVEAWRIHTTGNCDIHYFEGDHFFIHDETQKVVEVINNAVRKAMG
jgi:surfactin synthase thioesterase subunit